MKILTTTTTLIALITLGIRLTFFETNTPPATGLCMVSVFFSGMTLGLSVGNEFLEHRLKHYRRKLS